MSKATNKTNVQNLDNILGIRPLAILVFSPWIFFSTTRLFVEIFDCNKGSRFNFMIFCNRMNVKTSQSVPIFTFFGIETIQNSHFSIFLEKVFNDSKGSISLFFDILQQNGSSKTPEGPPFQIFGIVRFFKMIIFVLKLGFISTVSEFCFFKTGINSM